MSTFRERLHDAMIARDIRIARVAKDVGVSKVAVALWLKQDQPHMSALHLIKLSDLLQVSAVWLAVGRGPMLKTKHKASSAQE